MLSRADPASQPPGCCGTCNPGANTQVHFRQVSRISLFYCCDKISEEFNFRNG